MIRVIGVALVVGLMAGGSVLPASAASTASCRGERMELQNGRMVSVIEMQANLYVARLRRMGYNVDQVEDWGGCVKAIVDEPDGHSHIMFFDPDTLEVLTTN
ncbi:MAG: hypothetical protein P4M09_31405 [Devosia sp.]|nr:hypothetical protein [Devosia sp.]